ncbi:hypothetical protein [Comamonas testosteroni]|uniref:hypothetical protein n=1 Tax=Comamonas testosteroni TaxID=285 RepID=UPI0012D363DD|nr:hypothetical protein [Comamonas testosteroni]
MTNQTNTNSQASANLATAQSCQVTVAEALFEVEVGYGELGSGDNHILGTWKGNANDAMDAQQKAIAELWDSRLNTASCVPRSTVKRVEACAPNGIGNVPNSQDQGELANKVCRMDDLVGKDFKILAFRDLPLTHQLSIAQYMPLEEGAESETPASLKELLPAYLLQHGDGEWGVLNIAAERLKQFVMADEDRATGSETWEEYAAAYCAGGDVPHYAPDDRWPVFLSADDYETLLDGWHRMHSYMRSGFVDVPAIFAPEERHYELIAAQKGNVKTSSADGDKTFSIVSSNMT